jgi:cysteine desulfurase/selenocysteine lyase
MSELTAANVALIRQDFPLLKVQINNKPLIYFDNAASTQKPQSVIDAMARFYSLQYANVHRGVHSLCEQSTESFEKAREKIQHFINAKHREEVIFVRGTTEAINLVAQSYARPKLQRGDEIVITTMEHHSNIVPWQLVCEQTGAVLKVAPINEAGEIILEEFYPLLASRTRLVAVVHTSNSLGTINPVEKIIAAAHARKIPVLIDGAQAVAHQTIDVQQLDCDFYAFSGHKLFGPTGIGVLYGKADLLNAMPPYQGGGEMISTVTFEKTSYNSLPHKFEAGTPAIAEAIGLAAAIDYVQKIGLENITAYEQQLLLHAMDGITRIPDIRIIGTAENKASILSFVFGKIHPHDIGTILDKHGIAIRTGHHCTMPLMQRYNIPATTRASFAFYNTKAEIDTFLNHLEDVRKVFQ